MSEFTAIYEYHKNIDNINNINNKNNKQLWRNVLFEIKNEKLKHQHNNLIEQHAYVISKYIKNRDIDGLAITFSNCRSLNNSSQICILKKIIENNCFHCLNNK